MLSWCGGLSVLSHAMDIHTGIRGPRRCTVEYRERPAREHVVTSSTTRTAGRSQRRLCRETVGLGISGQGTAGESFAMGHNTCPPHRTWHRYIRVRTQQLRQRRAHCELAVHKPSAAPPPAPPPDRTTHFVLVVQVLVQVIPWRLNAFPRSRPSHPLQRSRIGSSLFALLLCPLSSWGVKPRRKRRRR